ncbi:MAG: DUF3187 family protein [Gammaproteobacteria bacterium]|nr:DUF3187 family protein [Gammaproteobacteria bacterium]
MATLLASGASAEPQFVHHRAYDPFNALFGVPAIALRTTQQSIQLGLTHNNVFMGGVAGENEQGQRLTLDGETSQITVRYSRRLNSCWALEASGSWVAHSRGWFDRSIDDWHQVFGLPDAGRDEVPFHQLNYGWSNNTAEGVGFELDQAARGLGDAFVGAQRYLRCDQDSTLFRAGVKLPLGSLSDWTGSGSTDAFVDAQTGWWKPRAGHAFAGSVGMLLPGSVREIQAQQSVVAYGTLAWQWQVIPPVSVGLQFDWHTATLDSDLEEVGSTAGMLSMNSSYITQQGTRFDFSVFEDIIVDTAPDIAIRLAFTRHYP